MDPEQLELGSHRISAFFASSLATEQQSAPTQAHPDP